MNDIFEYRLNDNIKYKIEYYPNGCKNREQYYDHNGLFHREDWLPDYQSWYDDGYLCHQTFFIHGCKHNICNPANISYKKMEKLITKGIILKVIYI